jgi:import inner membrane translocase subunit TIM23
MDREFFHRISKRRGDPSFQSVNNPAPDFYGEKVGLPFMHSVSKESSAF